MRWFWLFILALVIATAGLYTQRVRTNSAVDTKAVHDVPRGTIEPADSELPTPEPKPIFDSEPEPEPEPIPEAKANPEPTPVTVVEPEREAGMEIDPSGTYGMHPDGSFTVLATDTTITGSGSEDDPFMVDWVTLRSIELLYNPKEDKNDLPAWLDLLDGAHVKITGNTLVPVIATTTRELLVMQNPWDGCCVGIPPSPYDAIEVTLNHDVDFGSSAVGYGTVEGVFVLDPYVVDGWVLGLYMIDDGTYRSGEGILFSDF